MNKLGVRAVTSFLRDHAIACSCLALLTGVFTWFVTYGTWNLFKTEWLGGFYDAQIRSMIRGRLDVPPWAISPEAFIVDGKHYGYFGFGPALLRLPTLAFKGMNGRWSRLSVVAASVLFVLLSYLCLRLLRRLFGQETRSGVTEAFFVMLIGLGSTTVFLTCRAFVYHEAIAWGGAFALGFFYVMLRYLDKPSLGLLAGCAILSTLCLSTRVPVGMGTVAAMGFLAICQMLGMITLPPSSAWATLLSRFQMRVSNRPCAHLAIACLGVVVAFGSYVAVNQLKFGTWLNGSPMNYYERWHFHTNDCWDGKPFRLDVVPGNLWAYTTNWGLDWNRLPWIHLRVPSVPREHCYREPYTCLFSCMPALCLLALVGCFGVLRSLLRSTNDGARLAIIPVVGALASWGPILMSYTLTQRYLHDLLPFLVLTSAIGLIVAARWRRAPRWTLGSGVLALGLVSVLVNCSYALHYQRDQDGVAARHHVPFHRWKHEVDKVLAAGTGRALPRHELLAGAEVGRVLQCVTDAEELPRDPTIGTKVLVLRDKQTRVFDGTAWIPIPWDASLWETLEVQTTMSFPRDPKSAIEPLCISGHTEMTDMVFVEYAEDGRVVFGAERRGVFRHRGEPQAIPAEVTGTLRIAFDCLNDRLVVRWNDREVLAAACSSNRPRQPDHIIVGCNLIGHTASPRFSGRMTGIVVPLESECEAPER